jgi:hypothetical protein
MTSVRSRTRVPGWIVWSVRFTVTAHLVSVLAQAVLAGLFITGDVDLLRVHNINGQVASTLATLQFVAAVLLWRPGRGPSWPIWPSLLLTLLEGMQHTTGLNRSLDLHVPGGVLIFGLACVMAVWAWGRIERDGSPAGTTDAPAGGEADEPAHTPERTRA